MSVARAAGGEADRAAPGVARAAGGEANPPAPGSAPPRLPLLLVGHGTRSAAGVAEFGRFTARVRARAAGRIPVVDGGYIELASPSVADVVARMAAERDGRGLDLVALPLVLTAAGHGKGDVPAALARERARHPGLRYRYGRPLGPHPVLQEVLAARIGAALGADSRTGTFVVVTGRGSTDPDANAEVAKVCRLLWEGRGYDEVELSFVSLAPPGVPAAL
ncbi:MAG: hypothetical protein LBI49_11690, partial [Nocardiopsaceae bacterium]|nr:hypothetical protein [Nocardiopsaceae bacterium]